MHAVARERAVASYRSHSPRPADFVVDRVTPRSGDGISIIGRGGQAQPQSRRQRISQRRARSPAPTWPRCSSRCAGRSATLPSRRRRRRYARQAGRQDLAARHHRRCRATEADVQQEGPAAVQLQKSMDSAVDQPRATYASDSFFNRRLIT